MEVLRRFYEPLLLLNALGQIRGKRIKPELVTDDSGPNRQKIRRSFADGIAYICACEKDPDHVTATALEQTPQGITVWLAANGDIEEKVIPFLEDVLFDLHYVAEQNSASERQNAGRQILDGLITRVIAFNESRIQVYYRKARRYVSQCLVVMGEIQESSGKITAV